MPSRRPPQASRHVKWRRNLGRWATPHTSSASAPRTSAARPRRSCCSGPACEPDSVPRPTRTSWSPAPAPGPARTDRSSRARPRRCAGPGSTRPTLAAARSTRLTPEAVAGADLVIGSTAEHVRAVWRFQLASRHRAFTLGELVRLAEGISGDDLPAGSPGQRLRALVGRASAAARAAAAARHAVRVRGVRPGGPHRQRSGPAGHGRADRGSGSISCSTRSRDRRRLAAAAGIGSPVSSGPYSGAATEPREESSDDQHALLGARLRRPAGGGPRDRRRGARRARPAARRACS